MSSPDLPEIRARLTANGVEVRKSGRAPLRTLKSLLSNDPRPPLLSPAEGPPPGPDSRAASPELELLQPGAEPPIEVEVRRKTFGRRTVEEVPLLLTPAESAPPVDAPLALPAPAARPTPASPPVQPVVIQLIEPMQAAPPPPPPPPIPPRAAAELHLLLETLERRLRQEQSDLSRKILDAGVEDRPERRPLRAG